MEKQIEQPIGQNKQRTKIPWEVKKNIDDYLDYIVELEKENYDNKLVPFEQHEKKIRVASIEFFEEFLGQFNQTDKILNELLGKEEERNPNIPNEAKLSQFNDSMQKFKNKMLEDKEFMESISFTEPFQELAGIDFSFMDRVYAAAKNLAQENRFEEASSLFNLLSLLNPQVFEYLLGKASCLYELKNFAEAFEFYSIALILEPKNPFCFFQMANCLYQMEEFASSLEALRKCVEYAQDNPEHAELLRSATQVVQVLEKQVAA